MSSKQNPPERRARQKQPKPDQESGAPPGGSSSGSKPEVSSDRMPKGSRPNRIANLFDDLKAEIPASQTPEFQPRAVPSPSPSAPLPAPVEPSPAAPPPAHVEPSPAAPPPASGVPMPEGELISPPRPAPPVSLVSLPQGALSVTPGKGDGKEEEQILPATTILTPQGWESAQGGKTVVQSGQTDQPAVLAYSHPIQSRTTQTAHPSSLLLEVLDEDMQRVWSEDEILLVEQVTDQLTLALENARLFEESRTRAEQLAVLNEMSRELSSQLKLADIFETVYRYAAQLVDATNFYIALFNPKKDEVSFPLSVEGVQRLQWQPRQFGNGLTEYIFRTRQPLLIKEHVGETIRRVLDAEVIGREAQSWLGVPMLFGDRIVGMIAVQSFTQANLYNEAHRDMLSAVASQAAVAIENARLFEESRTRAEQLAVLNEMSRTLSTQLKLTEVVESVYQYSSRLLDTSNFFVALYDEQNQFISFPLVYNEKELVEAPSRPLGSGLTDYVLAKRIPLLLSQDVAAGMQELGIQFLSLGSNTPSQSWLGVPILFGTHILGVIAVQSITTPGLYQEQDRDLFIAVANQAAVAIENARLFEQTQTALSALEVSERYQKSIAQAVATLTERGIAALTDVLRTLGEAAQASRAYYVETQVDQRGAYWRLIAEWAAPGVPSQLNNPVLRRLSTTFIAPWIERLRKDGYAFSLTDDPQISPEEQEFLQSLNTRSLLQFAVQGRHELPGCIGFEQVDYGRQWSAEEIAALQVAASALTSTITREDLFTQVQINLADTEALYQASAHLNSAASYDEILSVLRQHTILGHVNAADVSLNLFDRPWSTTEQRVVKKHTGELNLPEAPDWLVSIARWSAKPDEQTSAERIPFTSWKLSPAAIFQPERAVAIMDVVNDPRIDDAANASFIDPLAVKSLLLIPLNVAGQWLGHIIGIYRQTTGFPEQEIRRLTSLSGQASVAIQNLHSLDLATQRAQEAQQRSEELATLNQITSAASRTLDLDQALSEVLSRILIAIEFDSGLVTTIDPVSQRLRLASHQNLPPPMVTRFKEKGFDGTACELTFQLNQIIDVPDLGELPEQFIQWKSAFEPPRGFGYQAYMGFPLEAKGKKLGTLCIFSRKIQLSNPSRISMMQAISQQVSVVIDNASLFQQTQSALSETETLYQASAELNAAQSFDDILQTLRRHSVLSDVDYYLSLDLFNHPWLGNNRPDKASVAAKWNNLPPEAPAHKRGEHYSLIDFPSIDVILNPSRITVIEDITNDPEMDENMRSVLLEEFLASSTVFAPLVVGGMWIGFIHAIYSQPTHFEEIEIRRLEVFANQAAIAAQNLLQLQQIQARAQYEYLTREIGSQISSSIDQNTILQATARATCQALGASHVVIGLKALPSGAVNPVSYLYDQGADHFIPSDDPEAISIKAAALNPLSAPISLRGETIGSIEVLDITGRREWSENNIALLQTVSSQAALSLDNARLFQETQTALTETENLYQASAELNAIHATDEILNVLRKYTILGQADNLVSINLFNRPWSGDDIPEWAVPVAHWTVLPPEKLRRQYSVRHYPASKYLSQQEPLIIENIDSDPRLDEELRKLYREDFLSRSTVFVPLVVGGAWIGFVNGIYALPTRFDEQEVRRLSAITGQAAIALQNLRLRDETLRRATQLQTAAEIARDTSSTLALDTLLQRAVNLLRDRFGYYHASIFLLDETGASAVVRESTGAAGEELKRRGHRLAVGSRSVMGQVTQSGQPLVLNDVSLEEAKVIHLPNPLLPDTRAELGIPLKIGDRVIGALDVQSSHPNAFSPDDITVLQTLADQIAVAVDNARSYEITQDAIEEIREADRLKSQFLANMSHELRTPLNSIIGFSRVILKGIDGSVNEQQSQDLTAIYNSGQHLLGLINDVLDLSRIEAGKMELAFEDNINLTNIVKGVMSTTVGLVKDKPIKLHQNIDPNILPLHIDSMKIRQVLLNLLSNAAKFTEEGSITVEATVEPGPDDSPEVVIRVIDTGPGIAPEDQVKLFQPFSQVDGSLTRKTGGSGLGLSICHHLVRMHGGRIGLVSEVGRGSIFYFTLPIVGPQEPLVVDEFSQPELPDVTPLVAERVKTDRSRFRPATIEPVIPSPTQPEPAVEFTPEIIPVALIPLPVIEEAPTIEALPLQQPVETPPAQPVIPKTTKTILAIDNDPQVIALYNRYMVDSGLTITPLNVLGKALDVVRKLQPLAITLDVAMQSSGPAEAELQDGWQLLEALKTDPLTRHIPVIIITLKSEEERAFNLGADEYMIKPILQNELLQAVKRLRLRI